MITKKQKQEIIKNLADKFSRRKTVVFFDYTGLTVNQFQELRRQLREKEMDCQVVKKTLVDLALKKANFKNIEAKELPGQLALVFGYQDEILPAKILYNFSKENESLKILTGLFNEKYLENEAVINLAKLPAREELLAKLVGCLRRPISDLSNTLQGNLRKLTFILKSCSV